MFAENAGDELEIAFHGTGISLPMATGTMTVALLMSIVDGMLHRTIDTYYDFANQQHTESIWHILNLPPGDHKIRLVVKGEKRPESAGTRVYITSATIFRTAPKKSDTFKFSFE